MTPCWKGLPYIVRGSNGADLFIIGFMSFIALAPYGTIRFRRGLHGPAIPGPAGLPSPTPWPYLRLLAGFIALLIGINRWLILTGRPPILH